MVNPNKYLAEFLGTMLLLVCILASNGNFLVVGGSLAAAIYFTGAISGGHINPAVSIAMFLNKKLSLQDLGGYMVAQVAGAISSIYLYKFVLTL